MPYCSCPLSYVKRVTSWFVLCSFRPDWFCYKRSLVYEHGRDTLGSFCTGQHCPGKPARTRGVYMVAHRRYKKWPIFIGWLFSAKEVLPMPLFTEMFGGVTVLHLYHGIRTDIFRKRLSEGCSQDLTDAGGWGQLSSIRIKDSSFIHYQ